MSLRYSNAESVTVVTDTSQYADGDLVGGLLEFDDLLGSTKTGRLLNVTVADKDGQAADLDIVIFSDDPANSTLTDNAAVDIDVADLEGVLAVVSIASTDYADLGTGAVVTKAVDVALISPDRISALVVSRGTPTYTTNNSLVVTLGVVRD